MIDKKVWRRRLQGVITLILSLFIVPSVLCGAASAGPSAAKPAVEDSFVLSIQGDLISLKAEEAPVLAIIKEIGRQMEIEIAGAIPDTEKVSIEFEKLTFDEAMARLGVDYAYVTGKGNRIMIYARRTP